MRNLVETNQTTAMVPATIRNCNISLGNMKSLETPVGMLLQIELLVIFTAFLLLFLVAFGSWRRCYNSRKFQLVIFAAYNLSSYVLTYALGLMHNAPFRNELFPIWAMFLMIALGSADSISVYSLHENEQWRRYNWQVLFKLIWLFLLIGSYWRHSSKVALACQCLFFVLLLKSLERACSLMAASRKSMERQAKELADYMSVEHESGGASLDEADPVRMKGYNYLVTDLVMCAKKKRVNNERCQGKESAAARHYQKTLDRDRNVTIEEVWSCPGGLLSSQGDKLKDLCLSAALAVIFTLRYTDYPLPQEAHRKTWNLFRHGLLLEENGYQRAFRVIEFELVFAFDSLYTKYLTLFQRGWFLFKLLEVIYVIVSIWATTSLLKNHMNPNITCQLATMPNGLSVDVLVTSVMIILFVIVELMQFFFMSFSEWAKLLWICTYVRIESWHNIVWIEWIIRVICRVQLLKPWERKLRQYSFLTSYSYKPSKLLNNMITAAYIDTLRDGQRQSKAIPLHEEVKQSVFNVLKSIEYPKVKNGQTSLSVNSEFINLSWACQLVTQTQVILVWHIATSFCGYKLPAGRSNSCEMIRNFRVATSLSKYLAYLVAFAPRLLPDHPSTAEYVFDQAIIEAKDFFQGCNSMDDHISKMERKGSGSVGCEKTIIEQGARLGNQLVNDIKLEENIWKFLAGFWAELVLYVAPSDRVEAHAKHLTRGGEFITHLFALLSHAGIKRDPPSHTKPCDECTG